MTKQVREFHETFGVVINDRPTIDSWELNCLRVLLLREEIGELAQALVDANTIEVLDALCDIRYVLDGAILSLGFDKVFEEAFAEVHASNMSKLGQDGKPLYRPYDGKVLKGPEYYKPVLSSILERVYGDDE